MWKFYTDCVYGLINVSSHWRESTLHVYTANHLQVFQQLDEGHQKQQEELSQELLEVKVNHNDTFIQQNIIGTLYIN